MFFVSLHTMRSFNYIYLAGKEKYRCINCSTVHKMQLIEKVKRYKKQSLTLGMGGGGGSALQVGIFILLNFDVHT